MLPRIDWHRLRRQFILWAGLPTALALLLGLALIAYLQAPAPLNLYLPLVVTVIIVTPVLLLGLQTRRLAYRLQAAYKELEAAANERSKELAGLNAIVEVVSQSLDLQETLIGALDKTMEIMNASGGGIALWQKPLDDLKLAAYRGLSPRLVAQLDAAPGPDNPLRDVIGSAEPQILDNTQGDPRLASFWSEADISCLACFPLAAGENQLGRLFLVCRQWRAHSAQDTALITSISRQISAGIYKARLFEAEQRRFQEAETLRQAGSAVTATLRLEEAVERILQQLAYVVPHDSASVQLLREGYLEIIGGRGWADPQAVVGIRFPVPGHNPNSVVVQSRQPLILADARAAYANFSEGSLYKRINSWLGVPLIFRGRIIGLLSVDSAEPDYFTADHARLMTAFGDQVAIAVEHASLYEQTRQELVERQRAEQQLKRAIEAAEAANRAKSTFLTNMGHELRTPLNAILGYSGMLLEEVRDQHYANFGPDLAKIQSAGQHLLEIINALLDLSKVEAGNLALSVEEFDLPALVDQAAVAVRPLIEQNQNTLQVERAESLRTMRSDPAKVRQILINILGNAAKFTQGGAITFSILPGPGTTPNKIVFRIADTGIGMSADELQLIFRAFTQADASITRKYGGTGLGLFISHRFCELLGGEITAESEKRVGSTFTIRLPAQLPVTPGPAALPQRPGARANTSRMLMIQSNPVTREQVRRTLAGEGYEIETADHAEAGLKLACEQQPDLILVGSLLPDMSQEACCRRLKSEPQTRAIPIIALTPEAADGTTEPARPAWCDDIEPQPVNGPRLQAKIKALLPIFRYPLKGV